MPGWLLPLVGVVGVLLMILGRFPVILAIAFGVSILFGLLGWVGKNSVARLRRVYADETPDGHDADARDISIT